MTAEGTKIRIRFKHADGLAAKGEKLTGFAIAGEDKTFVYADAQNRRRFGGRSEPRCAEPRRRSVWVGGKFDREPV
jgi:hypothetical protein